MNVQHLESLYDVVEQFTGVKVKERVPDYVLGLADQIVNVDLSAEDLQDRMRSGKVYPKERVESALSNFFTGGNLTRLRELALEEIAHLLDRRRQARKEENQPGVAWRVMVCLSSRSPDPGVLLRRGSRLADRLRAPWYAVYVRTPAERLENVDAATQRRIADTQALAHQLGAVPMTFGDGTQGFAEAAAAFVAEYGITHLVLGRSRRPWYRSWFGPSLIDRVLRVVPRVDVLVVGTG
jgi:two-component system sensor histidine kinase KdpD